MKRREAIKVLTGTPLAAALAKIPEVEELERVSIRSGDTLVITSNAPLRPDAIEQIRRSMGEAFPGVPVLVLEEGLKLEVLRPGLPLTPNEMRTRDGLSPIEEGDS